MALKSRNKVSAAFNMSSMTDIVFLLLIFFMITSTLVSPPAEDVDLPISNNQTKAKPQTTVTITQDLRFFVETKQYKFNEIESVLKEKLKFEKDIYISVYADKTVPMEYVTKIMKIAKRNKFKMILATNPK